MKIDEQSSNLAVAARERGLTSNPAAARRPHAFPANSDPEADAAELMADLAALVDAGLVAVSEDDGGRLRYGLGDGCRWPDG